MFFNDKLITYPLKLKKTKKTSINHKTETEEVKMALIDQKECSQSNCGANCGAVWH